MTDRPSALIAKRIPLERWAIAVYGDDRPGIGTLRRWARGGNISPPAEKHGRTYYVAPDAKYVATCQPGTRRVSLVERIHGTATKKRA